jgi:hypothetical protein
MQKELLSSLLLLIVAYFYYLFAGDINRSALADEFGAAGLPILYAWLLGILALVLLGKAALTWALARQHGERSSADSRLTAKRLGRATGMLAIGIAYVVVVPIAGYWLSLLTVIFLVAWHQEERPGWRLALISVSGASLFFVFFDLLLGIDMPAGIWSSLWRS